MVGLLVRNIEKRQQPEIDLVWVVFRLLFGGLIRVHSVETVITSAVSVTVCVCQSCYSLRYPASQTCYSQLAALVLVRHSSLCSILRIHLGYLIYCTGWFVTCEYHCIYDSWRVETTAGYDSWRVDTTAGCDSWRVDTTAGYDFVRSLQSKKLKSMWVMFSMVTELRWFL
jgi:hypothetical protein